MTCTQLVLHLQKTLVPSNTRPVVLHSLEGKPNHSKHSSHWSVSLEVRYFLVVKIFLVESFQPITVAENLPGDNASEWGGTSHIPFHAFHTYPSFGLSIIWITLHVGLCSQTGQCVAQQQWCKTKTSWQYHRHQRTPSTSRHYRLHQLHSKWDGDKHWTDRNWPNISEALCAFSHQQKRFFLKERRSTGNREISETRKEIPAIEQLIFWQAELLSTENWWIVSLDIALHARINTRAYAAWVSAQIHWPCPQARLQLLSLQKMLRKEPKKEKAAPKVMQLQ